MQDKPKRTNDMVRAVDSALETVPKGDRASLLFAFLMQEVQDNPVSALSDVMQYIAYAVHEALAKGVNVPVGDQLRALVISIAGGVATGMPEESGITAAALLHDAAGATDNEEAEQALRACREALADMVAHRDIQGDLDAVLRDDSAFDGLLPQ